MCKAPPKSSPKGEDLNSRLTRLRRGAALNPSPKGEGL